MTSFCCFYLTLILLSPDVLFSRSVVSDSFVTPWTVVRQALLSMGFPRQEYWSGLPFPSSGDLPDSGIKLCLLHCQADSLLLSHRGSPHVLVGMPLLSARMEKAMAPYSSTLAWKISWTEEPGRLQSMVSLRVGHD